MKFEIPKIIRLACKMHNFLFVIFKINIWVRIWNAFSGKLFLSPFNSDCLLLVDRTHNGIKRNSLLHSLYAARSSHTYTFLNNFYRNPNIFWLLLPLLLCDFSFFHQMFQLAFNIYSVRSVRLFTFFFSVVSLARTACTLTHIWCVCTRCVSVYRNCNFGPFGLKGKASSPARSFAYLLLCRSLLLLLFMCVLFSILSIFLLSTFCQHSKLNVVRRRNVAPVETRTYTLGVLHTALRTQKHQSPYFCS